MAGLLAISACIDVYDPNIKSNKDYLVFEGMIHTDSGPYVLTISHTTTYSNNEVYLPERGATCEIRDKDGHSYTMKETKPGTYVTQDAGLTGQPGNTYTLHVITKEGKEYQSDGETLMPAAAIDTLYAAEKSIEYLSGGQGNQQTMTDKGYDLYLNLSGHSSGGGYYMYNISVVIQYMVSYSVGIQYYDTYCWKTLATGQDITILQTRSLKQDAFRGFRLLYFSKDTSGMQFLINRYPGSPFVVHPNGYIAIVKQYSISEGYYSFLERLQNETSNQNRLFDPAVDQVTGNIHCLSNPGETVLGYFSASSVTSKALFLAKKQFNLFVQRMLPQLPVIPPDGYTDFYPPDFWINP